MTCHLTTGRLLRIDARQPISRLSVVNGCLWLTTTPADEDVILRTGDEWRADARWPVVVQALVETTVHVVTDVSRGAWATRHPDGALEP